MKRSVTFSSGMVILAAAVAVALAAPAKDARVGAPKELGPGAYQATIKAIVCDGCGEFIQKTMAAQPEIGAVVVDQKAKQVTFRVKDDARITVAQLQKVLKASAEEMGMGADYTLLNIRKVSSETR